MSDGIPSPRYILAVLETKRILLIGHQAVFVRIGNLKSERPHHFLKLFVFLNLFYIIVAVTNLNFGDSGVTVQRS